jgi:hypothetical protein
MVLKVFKQDFMEILLLKSAKIVSYYLKSALNLSAFHLYWKSNRFSFLQLLKI